MLNELLHSLLKQAKVIASYAHDAVIGYRQNTGGKDEDREQIVEDRFKEFAQTIREIEAIAEDDLPCCDPVSAGSINRWFDYWLAKERDDTSSRAAGRREAIQRICQCAIEGSRKAKRTKKQMRALVAKRLREVAEEMER